MELLETLGIAVNEVACGGTPSTWRHAEALKSKAMEIHKKRITRVIKIEFNIWEEGEAKLLRVRRRLAEERSRDAMTRATSEDTTAETTEQLNRDINDHIRPYPDDVTIVRLVIRLEGGEPLLGHCYDCPTAGVVLRGRQG